MITRNMFKVDDKVFGKVKGYPAWPARITQVIGKKYHVVFYGTNETAILKEDSIVYYLSNKAKLGKISRRRFFPEALKDIEADITKSGGTDGNDDQADYDDQNQSKLYDSLKAENKRKSEMLCVNENIKRKKTEDQNHNESVDDIDSPEQIISPTLVEAFNTSGTAMFESQTESSEINDTEPEDIAKGLMLLQVAEDYLKHVDVKDIFILPDVYIYAVVEYGEYVKQDQYFYKSIPPDVELFDFCKDPRMKVLPVRVNPNTYLGLVYTERNNEFQNEYVRAIEDAKHAQELLHLKQELLDGKEVVREHSLFIKILNCNDAFINKTIDLPIIEYKKRKSERLQLERDFLQVICNVPKCLGRDNPKTQEAMSNLQRLHELPVTAVTLLKRPIICEIMLKASRYIGNVDEWNYDAKQVKEFTKDAAKIRHLARKNCEKFEEVLSFNHGHELLDYVVKKNEVFKKVTNNMSNREFTMLCSYPRSRRAQMELILDEYTSDLQACGDNQTT